MIRYTLKCDQGHEFESWFQSASAFDALCARGMASCAVCGSTAVTKALMTPRVTASDKAAPSARTDAKPDRDGTVPVSLSTPSSPLERAIARLREEVERNSDYVGGDFATEARRMHDGEVPHRSIYGEARLDEARALAEDGVPVMPLPFGRRDKAN